SSLWREPIRGICLADVAEVRQGRWKFTGRARAAGAFDYGKARVRPVGNISRGNTSILSALRSSGRVTGTSDDEIDACDKDVAFWAGSPAQIPLVSNPDLRTDGFDKRGDLRPGSVNAVSRSLKHGWKVRTAVLTDLP